MLFSGSQFRGLGLYGFRVVDFRRGSMLEIATPSPTSSR